MDSNIESFEYEYFIRAISVGFRLLVEDFPKMFDFYHNILGFELNDRIGDFMQILKLMKRTFK